MPELNVVELYRDIVSVSAAQNAAITYEFAPTPGFSLKMTKHHHPWSIKSNEFAEIASWIIRHKLTRGYECATAFGLSSLAGGIGMRETGGKLLTMDAFIEEIYDESTAYRGKKEINTAAEPDGIKSAKWLWSRYGVDNVIKSVRGWSPDNVQEHVETMYGPSPQLDYVFIDAGHWDEALLADMRSIRPFLADRWVVFVHDMHCFSEPVLRTLAEEFGSQWQILESCRYPMGFNLGLMARNLG